jgi:GT2 family glycosyltransferase
MKPMNNSEPKPLIDLSIVIVSWNVRDLLRQSLRSVFRETVRSSIEVFVVDNNSHDGSAAMVSVEFPQVRLIANTSNAGFAKANNQAIRQASGRYVLLLNPDTEILDNSLDRSVAWMDENKTAVVMGCRLLNPDRSLQASVRRFPTRGAMALTLLKLHRVFPKSSAIQKYMAADFDYNQVSEVDQVMGAFFMIRSAALNQIGLLDEGYYIWFEEVDYCARAKQKGWSVMYNPDATIIHHYGQSFRQVLGIRKQIILNNSLLRYFSKHGRILDRLTVYLLYLPSLFPSLVVSLIIQPFQK